MIEPYGGGRLVLKVVCGSRAHGLSTEESDTDTRGVCIPGGRALLGLSTFEQEESEGGDHVIFAMAKFVRLALQGNPNIIETLYTEGEHLLLLDGDYGKPLRDIRNEFLSRQVGERFMRYGLDQLKRMERHHRWLKSPPPKKPGPEDFGAMRDTGRYRFPNSDAEKAYRAALKHFNEYERWRKGRNPKRAGLEERYGYDTKHAMHLCRLLKMGAEILTECVVAVHRSDAEWLLGIRRGAMPYDDLLAWAQTEMARLPGLMANSKLPSQPNARLAEDMLVELQARFLAETSGKR